MSSRRETVLAAVVGVLASLVTVAIGDLAARFVDPASSPLFAVGSWVIDIVPAWVKETAIALFGTGDKVALIVGLGMLVIVLAVAAGVLEYRKAPWGVIVLVAVGTVAAAAAGTRTGANLNWVIPTALGVVAGAFVLRIGTNRLRMWIGSTRVPSPEGAQYREGVSRRGFLTVVVVAAAGAAVAGVASRALSAVTAAGNAVRDAIVLPKPATTQVIPAGAELGIPGVSSIVTPNGSFYRIDTALQVPVIDPATWSLKVTGMVDTELEITWDELLALPMEESAMTLTCVSNEVGGDLIGNAVWLGHPIRLLLARAGVQAGADMVLSTSIDGFTAGTPLEALTDENRVALLAVGMNGETLPLIHGFPVRMVVAGLYGYVSATKWVTELKVSRFADESAYWTQRGWSALGPIKTQSRIDAPRGGTVQPGMVAVAGVAWAQHTGIQSVQVRVDGGQWAEARLADAINSDTWRQWVFPWEATTGTHTLEVRATDASGFTQSENRVDVIPDGAEGWHSITVTVS